MGGIVINLNPTALNIGHYHLNWYSVIVVLAVAAAVVIAVWEGKRKGIASDVIFSLAPWTVMGGLIGARLFHVIDRWSYYAQNPLQIFMLQNGGLAIWGALAGGAVAAFVFARAKGIPFLYLADTLVPALLVAQIIGRFACIIDGDAVGAPTTLPWGFVYTNPNAMVPAGSLNVPVHPYPVYDQIWNLVGLFVALRLRTRLESDGLLFMTYLSIYGAGRLFLSFVRTESIWFWGLQEAQVVGIAMMLLGLAAIFFLSRRGKTHLASEITV